MIICDRCELKKKSEDNFDYSLIVQNDREESVFEIRFQLCETCLSKLKIQIEGFINEEINVS